MILDTDLNKDPEAARDSPCKDKTVCLFRAAMTGEDHLKMLFKEAENWWQTRNLINPPFILNSFKNESF